MGLRHSQQRYVHGFSPDSDGVRSSVAGMDYAYTISVTESQYGSWTKISLADSTVQSDDHPTQEHAGAESFHPSPAEEVGVAICSQFLTQPPSEQQDSIIREVAEKLMDVETDVSVHSKADHSTSFPPQAQTQPQTKPQTPQHKPALHYSLLLSSPSEEGTKKEAISASLFDHFESLVEQVEPEGVANKLYGIAVLNDSEVEQASDGTEPKEDRARTLMQLVKKKLWKNPGWFVDVCKILRACGVKAISQVIDDVQKKCPSEEVSILSTPSPSISTAGKGSILRRQTSCHGTFTKLEESFKDSGLQGATEYVRQLSAEQPVQGLIHKACLVGVDVSTLDLLLSVLAEKNHDINSKSECGQTPLHVACAGLRSPAAESAALDINVEQRLKIEHLLSHKASNWIKDKDGNTPLHLTVLRADNQTVSTLLDSGKRCLNTVNKRGNSALHLACKLGLVDIVRNLCGFNADASLQNKKMRTALHLACTHEHNQVALGLASHDPSTLDAFDNRRMTPLHIASKRGNDQLALSLLKLKNCSLNKIDEDDRTPLHYACVCGSLVLAASILEKNSNRAFVDMQDRYGDTALHIASRHGYTEVVKELLSYRANKDIVNQEGKTPVDIAIEGEHNTIATKMMRKRGWNQRRKSLRKVRKLRRTLTQASLASSIYQSEMSEVLENSSEESGEDETVVAPRVTKRVIREN